MYELIVCVLWVTSSVKDNGIDCSNLDPLNEQFKAELNNPHFMGHLKWSIYFPEGSQIMIIFTRH